MTVDYIHKGPDGQPCPYVSEAAVREKLSHHPDAGQRLTRLRGLVMIHVDLRQAESMFARLAQEVSAAKVDRDVVEALWWAGSVKYARCFNNSTERRTRLDKNGFARDLEADVRPTHDFLMDARDNHIAHASSAEHESANFLFVLESDGLRPIGRKLQSVAPTAELAQAAAALCRIAAEAAYEQAKSTSAELFSWMMAVPPDVWRSLAICPTQDPDARLIEPVTYSSPAV